MVYAKNEEHSNSAFYAEISGETILYCSAGYTTSDAFTEDSTIFTKQASILIFGAHGSAAAKEAEPNYPLTDSTHTLLQCVKDLGISLSPEEYQVYTSITVLKRENGDWHIDLLHP